MHLGDPGPAGVLGAGVADSDPLITRLLVIHRRYDGQMIKIYDEEYFVAMRAAERRSRRSQEGPPAQAN